MATPNIVPRADQEGGLGTSAKSWGKLFIENPTSGGTAAATISNLDVDQVALDINANNTTANIIDVSTSTLTTGKVANFDITDTSATTTANTLLEIDYDKTGILGVSQAKVLTGIDLDISDTQTNDAGSSGVYFGQKITINHSNNQGSIAQTGLMITCTGADAANTKGIVLVTEDGGVDLSIRSDADSGDKFTIATTTAGATTISTIDDDGTNANLTFSVDGKSTFLIGSGSTAKTFAVQTSTAANPAFEFFGEDGNSSTLRIYEKAGATTDDFCQIQVVDRGATAITTTDAAGSQAALLQLSPDGDLIFTDVTGNNSNDVVREVKMGTGFVTIVAEVDIFDANTTDHGVIKQIGTVQIPQFARIKSATVIVKELSNLATFNFELGLGTNTGVSAGTAPANYQALLASDKAHTFGTDSAISNVGPSIGSGSGNLKKQFYSGRGAEDVVQTDGELSADNYLYIVSEGTSNGTTDATAGRVLVYLDYYGLF
jgi:hypothetical protein